MGFVVGRCLPAPLARDCGNVLAGLRVAREVGEFLGVLDPTASVTTSVTVCLWLNGVGRAVGDRESGGGLFSGCGRGAFALFAGALGG